MEAEHTPTPWSIERNKERGIIWIDALDAPSEGIADLYHRHGIGTEDFVAKRDAEANAAFIVRACNSFDALVAALKEAREEVDDLVRGYLQGYCRKDPGGAPMRETAEPDDLIEIERVEGLRARCDAALAKAEAA